MKLILVILTATYRSLIGLLCLVWVSPLSAQIEYEPGYYLNSSGEKVVGQIGNELWGKAPEEITFVNEQGEETVISRADMSEFSIDGKVKFLRAMVPIDTSTNMLNVLSEMIEPLFDTQSVFLLVHIEGNVMLAEYLWEGHPRYFLSTDDGNSFIPLIYKKYRLITYDENGGEKIQIRENIMFKNQLLEHLSQSGVGFEEVANLEYSRRDLLKLIAEVNGDQSIDYSMGSFLSERVEIAGRLELTRWNLKVVESPYTVNTGYTLGGSVGTSFLIKFPFERVTLGLNFAPSLRFQNKTSDSTEFRQYKIRYLSLEFPISGRLMYSFSPSTRVFAGVGYTWVFHPTKSSLQFEDGFGVMLNSSILSDNFFGELGCSFLDKYSLHFLYQKRNPMVKNLWQFDMTSLVFGMRLF